MSLVAGYWGDTDESADMAKKAMELLLFAYPGHPWYTEFTGDRTGGSLRIYHLDYGGKYCQVLNHKKGSLAFYSASEFKRAVLGAGGEWLERCRFARNPRKPWDETPIRRVDGVPLKDQPIEYRMEVAAKAAPDTLRETPLRKQQEEENGGQLGRP